MVFISKLFVAGSKFSAHSFMLELGLFIKDDSVGEVINKKLKVETHNNGPNY